MRAFRQGEDVPAGVAREWAEWGRHPDYIFSVAGKRPRSGFETWRGSLRAYSFADDGYAPSASVAALVDGFRTPDREHIHLAPADIGAQAIGHFGAFRPKMQESLWAGWRDWLLGLTSSAAARRSA